MSETPERDRTEEVADRIRLGLGDEHAQELTRDIFRRGLGIAVGLALFAIDIEDETLISTEESSEPEEQTTPKIVQ